MQGGLREGELDGSAGGRRAVDGEEDVPARDRPAAHHQHRAGGVGGQMTGGGAEQQRTEPAQAPAADHDQGRRARLDLQHRHRFADDDLAHDLDPRRGHGGTSHALEVVGEGAPLRLGKRAVDQLAQSGAARLPRLPGQHVRGRPAEGVYKPEPHPPQSGLACRDFHGRHTRRRAVHPHHNRPVHRAPLSGQDPRSPYGLPSQICPAGRFPHRAIRARERPHPALVPVMAGLSLWRRRGSTRAAAGNRRRADTGGAP